jgi:predicted LPLAT superfamily acyltransferase
MSGVSSSGAGGWAKTPERSNALALRVMAWIAVKCGRRVARLVLHPIALYFLLFAPAARRHSGRYLARALDRAPSWLDIYRHFHAFCTVTLDRVYLLRGRMDLFDITVRDEAIADAVLADGRGAFLVGAHLGSFEVLRAVGASRGDLRIAMVMYPDNARKINDTLRAIAPTFAPEIIPLGRMGSMLAIRDWLDSGGLAGVLGDRVLPGESPRAAKLPVMFLGRETVLGDGPFRLAALLRRRVIFMAGVYLGGNRYDVSFDMLADFSAADLTWSDRDKLVTGAVRAYAARLEAVCRNHPTNWFNFHDFWRED